MEYLKVEFEERRRVLLNNVPNGIFFPQLPPAAIPPSLLLRADELIQ